MSKRKRGRPSLGHTAELSVRMSPEMLRALKKTAKVEGVSVSQFVRQLISEYYFIKAGKQ